MKIRIYFITALMISIGVWGCKKQELPIKPEQSTSFSANLDEGAGVFSAAKTTTNINITAGTNGWSLSQSPANNWLIPDKNFGAGNYKLRLTLNANTTGVERTVQVKLLSTNASLPAVLLSITQAK